MPNADPPRNGLVKPDTGQRNGLQKPGGTPAPGPARTPFPDTRPETSPGGNTVDPKQQSVGSSGNKVRGSASESNRAGLNDPPPPFTPGIGLTVRPGQLEGPPRFFHEMSGNWHWGQNADALPDFKHPLWSVPNVHVQPRVWPLFYDNAGPDKVADDVVNIYRWFRDQFPKNHPPFEHWAFSVFRIGDVYLKNARYLFNHPDDRPGNNVKYNAPWAKAGIDWNRDWGRAFWPRLARIFDQYFIPNFDFLTVTSENGPGDDQGGYRIDGGPGWVEKALADPRANSRDHLVDGASTFAERWRKDRRPDGTAFPEYDENSRQGNNPPIRDPANHDARERYAGVRRNGWDYARFKGIVEPMQAAFPNMPAVEYGAHADGPDHPVLDRPGPLGLSLYNMQGIFHTPWQGPDWYGQTRGYSDPDGVQNSYLSSIDPNWETPSNWIKHYPKPESSPFTALSYAQLQCGRRLIHDTMFTRQDRPLCPWVTLTYAPNEEALEKTYLFLQHAVALGVRRFVVWEQDFVHHPSTADRWYLIMERLNKWYSKL